MSPSRVLLWLFVAVVAFLVPALIALYAVRQVASESPPMIAESVHMEPFPAESVPVEPAPVEPVPAESVHVDSVPVEQYTHTPNTATIIAPQGVMVATSGSGSGSGSETDLASTLAAIGGDAGTARDPHTSMATLKAFMAERVEVAVDRVAKPDLPRRLVDNANVPEVDVAIAERIAAAEVAGQSAGTRPREETWVWLRWENLTKVNPSWWPDPMTRGTLVADIQGPGGNATVRAALDEKPWIERPPASAGRGPYIVVSSGALATSKEEAIQSLNRRTADAMAERVRATAAARPGVTPSAEDVARQVRAQYGMFPSNYVDRAVVAVDRPYGRVWFASALVNASPDQLRRLADNARGLTADRRDSWAKMIVGSVGMILVLLVVYAALNAITRGYFRPHLRMIAVLVLAVAVAVMVLIMA
jgi:hypothetical protein